MAKRRIVRGEPVRYGKPYSDKEREHGYRIQGLGGDSPIMTYSEAVAEARRMAKNWVNSRTHGLHWQRVRIEKTGDEIKVYADGRTLCWQIVRV